MTIRKLLKNKGAELIGVHPDTPVGKAIEKMVERNIGALIIISDTGKPLGLFTERDALKAWVKAGKNFEELEVKDIMTVDLVVIKPEDDLNTAMSLMNKLKIRHLPVVEDGKVIGMISIRDVVNSIVGKLEAEVHYLKEYISEGV
ncbi:MAG: CBS domain-containing protein [Thermodesulfovibrionales bacterium]|nr:CBS domain-containing protein [Thermodesulfovibrionales bacterium]